MEQDKGLISDRVSDEELLARIVLAPKDIDAETGLPKDSFISLRDQEGGVSFLRFDYLGDKDFKERGFARERLYNDKRKVKKYSFVGWMQGLARDIKALAPNMIELTVDSPGISPEHVNVRFFKSGVLIKGIVTDAEVLDVLDNLYHALQYVKI